MAEKLIRFLVLTALSIWFFNVVVAIKYFTEKSISGFASEDLLHMLASSGVLIVVGFVIGLISISALQNER